MYHENRCVCVCVCVFESMYITDSKMLQYATASNYA